MKYNLDRHGDLVMYLDRFKSLPDALKEEMLSWPEVRKSPYSRSFYSSKKKRWDFTPEGCKRISNHWNFRSRRDPMTVHCITDIDVRNSSHWTLATYVEGLWRVESSLPIYKPRKRRP